MRTLYKVLLGLFPLLIATTGFSQTTITTVGTTYTGTNSCGAGGTGCFITFVVNNTNTSGIILTGLSQWTTTSDNGATATLLVSTTSLSGPVTLPSTSFTQVATGTVSGVTTTGINPVLSNMSYLIPASTQVRFLLQVSTTTSYSGSGSVAATPNTFTTGGVSLHTGDYTISGSVVGYGGANTPRSFTGAITFIPALPCVAPPTAGTTTVSATQVCAASNVLIGLNGNSQGTGQTYQLLTASAAAGPYTPVGAAQGGSNFSANPTSTTFYRIRVLCGAGADTSAAVQVTVPSLFPGGTYTINNSQPTAGANFNTFTDAVAAISCGISGPVIFNVSNNATPYNEQFTIPNIATTSATNTVTFNGNNATISFNSAAGTPGIVNLNGADWIRLKRLTIRATNPTQAYGVVLTNDADNNLIDSCTIAMDTVATTSLLTAVAITGSLTSATTSGSNCDNNTISNNTLVGGYYCLTVYGNTAAGQYSNGTVISNNVFRNYYVYGIYAGYTTNTLIERNNFSRPSRTSYTTFYGMYLFTSAGGVNVRRNLIHDPSQNQPGAAYSAYGIYFASVTGTAASPNEVSNNLIYNMRHDGALYGLYSSNSAHTKYYHNTISLDDATATTTGVTRGFYESTIVAGLELKNNIFSLNRGGTGAKHALYWATTISQPNPFSARNNVYNVPNPGSGGVAYYNATTYPTLAAYQAVSMQDTGSVEANPVFASPGGSTITSYTPTNASINNLGVPTVVATDITGAPRNATTPDVGVLEFTPGPCTAPPTAGTVTVSDTAVCSGTTVSFDLSGNSFGLGQTYVWQSAPALAGPYTPVSTASTLTGYNQAVTTTTYFRAAATCGTSTAFSDTQLVTVIQPLVAGTYTINAGAPATATNFQSFAAAAQRMQCGITGAVVFNVVAGSGPYNNDQFYLPSTLTGTSATNTITVNGNGNVLDFTATNSNQRAAVMLSGVDYVTVNNLVINVNTTASTYGFGVQLINGADNNTFSGCTVNIDSTATSSLFAGMVISGSLTSATGTGSADCDSNRFLNNTVNGGYYGMTNVGNSAAVPNYSNVFRGNDVRNFYVYGVYGLYNNGWIVDSNSLSRPTRPLITTFYGVALSTSSLNATVSRNRIHNPSGTNPTISYSLYALYCTGSDATAAQPNLWVNNMVYNITGNPSVYGIYNSSSDYQIYRHNTIALDDTTYAGTNLTYGLYQVTLATGIDVRNNIFSLRRTGSGTKSALYFGTATTTFTSNYNDFYVNGGTGTSYVGYLSSGYGTLTAWQTGTGKDTASVDIDPMFAGGASGTNLTPTNIAIDNLGQAVGVTVDAFGNSRSLTLPDLGAIEWSFIPPCAAPTALSDAAASASANVGWVGSTSTNLGYEFHYSTSATPPTGASTPVSGTSVSLSGLTPGTIYYYCVRTVCGPNSYSPYVCDSFTTCTPPPATLSAAGSPTPTTAIAICQGDTAQLRAPGGAGNTYLFLLNGVVTGTGAGPDSVLRTTQPGTYRVVVTNATGCYDTSAAAGLTVTVNPLPVPVVTQTDYNVLSTGSFSTYQWNLGGTPVVGATSQTYTAPFTGNGMYTVTVTDANGCRGTSSSFNLTTASVGGAAGVVASVRIFPNPTTGRVSIESAAPVRAQVWTVDGRRLLEVDNATSVDLSALAPGVYTLRLTNAEGIIVATEKVTKTN